MSFDDESAARELDLYAENESALYGQFKSIIANLKKKIESGKYDASKAPKLWGYWYDAAAKRYVKEFGGEVRTAFPASLRGQLAKERAKDEYQKIMGGEYGPVVVKAANSNKPKRSKTRRSMTKRSSVKRRKIRRLLHMRVARRRHGWGVKRIGFIKEFYAGDRVKWISEPWGHKCHGTVRSILGGNVTIEQDNGTVGVVPASRVSHA